MATPLEHALEGLGLTGHEARVLAALVEQSPSAASWVAKRTGISRSSVYTTLDALVAKGLVGTSYANEVKQFTAAGHEALMELLVREQERASARVAAGASLREHFERNASAAPVPEIVFFEGAQGLQRVYMQMLREARGPGPMLILRDEFIWRAPWAFVHEAPWRKRVAELKARVGLETRVLVNDSATEREHADDYATRRATEVRYLPSATRFEHFACYLLGDVVSLLSFDDQALIGLRIANRTYAAGFRTLFEALWTQSGR